MANKYDKILGEYREKDETVIPAETDPLSLHLDQTTPQTITGDTFKLDTLKSKSILGTDANGKIIEGAHQDISGKEDVGVAAGLDAQHLLDFTHGDIAHANRAALDNVSGTNTGDQVGDGVTITGAGTVADPFVATGGGFGGEIDGGSASTDYFALEVDGGSA
jgi:hypothetical protein